jgi:hypothetical protein
MFAMQSHVADLAGRSVLPEMYRIQRLGRFIGVSGGNAIHGLSGVREATRGRDTRKFVLMKHSTPDLMKFKKLQRNDGSACLE